MNSLSFSNMKAFIFLCLVALSLAEPPVGDGYPSARSSHHHDHDHQRSLTQEYGVPEFGARNQKGYSAFAARSQPSQTYGTPARSAISQEYGVPNLRSGLSQEYGPPSFRSGPLLQYGVPDARGLSQQYGPPRSHSSPSSHEYEQDVVIESARSSQDFVPQIKSASVQNLNGSSDFSSDSYSVPQQGSYDYNQPEQRMPSQEYGVPSQRSNEQFPAQKYGPPNLRNAQTFGLGKPAPSVRFNAKTSSVSRSFQSSFGPRNSVSQTFGSPGSLSTQYGAPSARNFDSYSQSPKSISQSYLPSSRSVSQTYGVPSERGVSTEYGVPEADGNLKTNAIASQYNLASRSSPSNTYGAPQARMPSEQYGVPEQYNAQDSQGYNYDRNALDELLNQEPANYDFGYKVNDFESGSDFGHSETRQDNRAEGSYFVVLPDGTKQIVEYEADERGFKPRISVETVEVRTGGYEDSAANKQRSADGPY